MRRSLLSVLLVTLLSLQAYAQRTLSVRAQKTASPAASSPAATRVTLGQSVIALTGPWKFRVGDDPHWAESTYDDSKWESMDLTPKAGASDPTTGWSNYVPGWTVLGHPDYWGYAWYRIHVLLEPRAGEQFAVAGPGNMDDVYQVFYNGVLLGSFGKFPDSGDPTEYYSQPMMFKLPLTPAQGPQEVVLAFRVWMEPGTLLKAPDAGGFHNAPLLGDVGAISANYELARLQLYRTYAIGPIIAALFFLLAIMAFSLRIFDRTDMVYRWLGVVFLLTSLDRVAAFLASWTQSVSIFQSVLLKDVLLGPLILGGWVMVWFVWFRLKDLQWMPNVIAALTVMYMVSDLLGEDLFFNVIPHDVSVLFHLASVGIRILFLLPLIFIVMEGVNKEGLEGLLALPAVMLVVVAQFQDELAILHFHISWFPFDAQLTLSEIAYLTLAAVIFVLLLRRLQISLQRQQDLASDVKQASEVQKVLIPEQLPKVFGFVFESEYRPARDVGGDFFQIIPLSTEGNVLIVAGDVTGKGLQAGMLGALIVGALRTEAAHSSPPLAMLRSLNAQLYGRGNATCLVMQIDENGNGLLANAGHLPPYLNGKELPMEGAVPLGVIPNADFSEMRFKLKPGDRLMLLSDGVAEAQDEHGRLFGFDRIRTLLERPVRAADVAAAAQAFGQEDDISVLSIVRDSYTWISGGREIEPISMPVAENGRGQVVDLRRR
jgi:Stage II sporulation protein E (SpoIIE)